MISTNVLLGAIAGVTIFLGLPVARWRGASERLRGTLAHASAGVLLFLVIEVGYHAMETVEASARGGDARTALRQGLILIAGFALGLIGLAWLEEHRARKRSAGADALEVATMIAIGIGLHNFAEGLAIGQSFAGGAISLGTVLVIGFALHNATEGFGIAGPLVGREVSWGRLLWLGLIAGGPTALGALFGGVWVSPVIELLFLSLAAGSLVYVTRELLRIRFTTLGAVAAMTALTCGLFVGFGTDLVVEVAQSRSVLEGAAKGAGIIRFANMQVSPATMSLTRGQAITIENDGSTPLIFEGNGLFVGEVVAPPGGQATIAVTGGEGQYHLVDERGKSGLATVTVQPGGATADPLEGRVNAVGALTVLEGHVRAARDLHERGVSGQGPNPALDLKRAGKHAGHPQHELLEGTEPDALALQKLLRERQMFDPLNNAMTAYVAIAGDGSVLEQEFNQKYQAAIDAAERARAAIAGDVYQTPEFRARAARFVMNTATSEYTTACEGGHIAVEEPGVPGKDNYIEYQDAHSFLQAAHELLKPVINSATPDAQAAFNRLLTDVFASVDPRDPKEPVPPAEVKALVERAEGGLAGTAQTSQAVRQMDHG